ncbi:MAG: response regulator [Agitococcus sp.]|nr:response regulator [Agitococcus sp.]
MDTQHKVQTLEAHIGRLARHWLVGSLLLAACYFLTGKLGILLAAPPGYATIVWPASGIALGWILLFGRRLLLGIVLGSFAVNVTVVAHNAGLGLFDVGWTVPLLIALGAAAQAWLGTWLIQRYVSHFFAFHAPHIVIRTLVLGGGLATLFNATWSTAVLYGFGVLTADLYWHNWFTWWVGDSIGVWIFTPLVLVWGLAPPYYERMRALMVTMVASVTFILAALAFLLATALEKTERAGNFQLAGAHVVSQMQQHLAEYDQFSLLLRAFFQSSDVVTRAEFKQFVHEWSEKHSEVQAVEWAPLISQEQRGFWQKNVSQDINLPTQITEKQQKTGTLLAPAQSRTEYLPIEYIEPFAKNYVVIGFDILTHAGSKAFLELAAQQKNPILSAPRILIQTPTLRPAALLYTPVFKTPAKGAATWDNLKGFVIVVLKTDEVLAYLTQKIMPDGQSLLVTEQKTGIVLYGQYPTAKLINTSQQMGLHYISSVKIGQQIWRLELWPKAQHIAAYNAWLTWMVLIIGLIGTSIAISYTLVSTGHYQYLEHEVIRQTQTLRLQNEALEQARIDAERANASKGLFLANMSHEIRTPMNGVLGMTDLLQTTHLSSQQQQFVRVLHHSGKALLHIINDILDFSKVEAGKMDIEHIDMDLETLLLECASIFAMTAEEKRLDFLASIAPNTPVFIQSDPTRLRQILLNLLSNAFKFTQHGGISLRVQTQQIAGHTYLQFVVTDTGIGMTAEQKGKLFQAFSQADSSTTRQFGGTGLGLSISKRLVDLMHGEMVVDSRLGRGTTFAVTLPYQAASEDYIHSHTRPLTLLNGVKVLFVDHSVEFSTTMTEQARAWGMVADAVDNGESALLLMVKAYQTHKPYDLVILDALLAPMTGLAIAHKMAELPELAAVKRILLTTLRAPLDQQVSLSAALTEVIPKPTSTNALRDSLLRVMGEKVNEPAVVNKLEQDDNEVVSLFSGKRVLIAEDNLVNQMVIMGMLKKLGLAADITNNGLEAYKKYMANPLAYDLIMMDCEMPVLDGYLSTAKMRDFEREQQLRPVHIIALTAHAMREQQQRCLDVGMNNFLAKPLAFARLKQVLVQTFA